MTIFWTYKLDPMRFSSDMFHYILLLVLMIDWLVNSWGWKFFEIYLGHVFSLQLLDSTNMICWISCLILKFLGQLFPYSLGNYLQIVGTYVLRDRPFNLKRGGYGFLFRSEFIFRTTQELEYLFFLSHRARIFFPEFNIRLYDKNSESHYFFFPPPKSEYFFQQHWESEYFFRK